MKHKDLMTLNDEEAKAKLVELKKAVAKEKGLVASGTRPENPGKIRVMRRTIARILTFRHQRLLKSKESKTDGRMKQGNG
ncbi:MAG: 50S ribosomal protein L29 [Candidatus Diapherotrites archaeon]|nr:50S ribosomal protein L29 [Candidatus Diapherotrites archaeon]